MPGDLPDALSGVAAVTEASTVADGTAPIDEAAQLDLAHDAAAASRLWTAGAGDGFALLRGHELDVVVTPSARGQGLGTELATAALAVAPARVTAWSHAGLPAAAALAARLGFAAVRELWVMARPLSPDLASPTVEGVTIRGYRDSDAAEVLRVNAAAFAHHPEQGGMDEANLRERMSQPWFDPAGLLVADAGEGRLLAFHWTKQHSPELGEVYVVAVDPAAQGRGLGKAVTAAGLAHLAGHGLPEVILYVEADNDRAVATYAGLGFAHTQTHVQYAR